MPVVKGVVIYLGNSPAAKHAAPAQNLMIDDGFLCQQFRRSLLEAKGDPARFRAKVDIPELPPVNVKWTPVGQTAGVAFWERVGRIGAASMLLNGTECDDERAGFVAAFMSHGLTVPPHVWEIVAKEPKPLNANLFFDLYSLTDPVIATAAPASANAFFILFGTTG